MRHGHEQIREILPEYLNNKLSPEERSAVDSHLESCADCREERDLLTAMLDVSVPEPGDMLWRAMPRKVMALSSEERTGFMAFRWLLRPLPIAAACAVFAIAMFLAASSMHRAEYADPLFVDPLAANVLDLADIAPENLAYIDEDLLHYPESIVTVDTDYDRSYYMDIASLSSEEVNSLYEALAEEQQNGGVL